MKIFNNLINKNIFHQCSRVDADESYCVWESLTLSLSCSFLLSLLLDLWVCYKKKKSPFSSLESNANMNFSSLHHAGDCDVKWCDVTFDAAYNDVQLCRNDLNVIYWLIFGMPYIHVVSHALFHFHSTLHTIPFIFSKPIENLLCQRILWP